jgi:hypothetical protein
VKITFQPSKASVLAKLGDQLTCVQSEIDSNQEELDKLEAKTADNRLYNPHANQEILGYKAKIGSLQKVEASLHDQIGLLESDPSGFCKAETEI